MQIGILGARNGWYVQDLRRAQEEHFTETLALHCVTFDSLRSRLGCGQETLHTADLRLCKLDAILVRSMPPGSLEQVIFRMDALQAAERAGVLVINSPRALETSIDKYLSLSRLASLGLPVPRTVVTQRAEDALQAFQELGGDVVVKPLFGSEGRGIIRVSDPDLADRVFRALAHVHAVLYLQEYVPNPGFDIRVLAIGRRLWAIRRHAQSTWKTNIAQGGRAESCSLSAELSELALAAVAGLNAEVAAVDLLPRAEGPPVILEVNAVPGWRALSQCHQLDVARFVLQHVRDKLTG